MLSWISSLINHDFSENDDSAIPPLAIAGGIALGKITVGDQQESVSNNLEFLNFFLKNLINNINI